MSKYEEIIRQRNLHRMKFEITSSDVLQNRTTLEGRINENDDLVLEYANNRGHGICTIPKAVIPDFAKWIKENF